MGLSIEKTHQKGALCVRAVHLWGLESFFRLHLVQRSGGDLVIFRRGQFFACQL